MTSAKTFKLAKARSLSLAFVQATDTCPYSILRKILSAKPESYAGVLCRPLCIAYLCNTHFATACTVARSVDGHEILHLISLAFCPPGSKYCLYRTQKGITPTRTEEKSIRSLQSGPRIVEQRKLCDSASKCQQHLITIRWGERGSALPQSSEQNSRKSISAEAGRSLGALKWVSELMKTQFVSPLGCGHSSRIGPE